MATDCLFRSVIYTWIPFQHLMLPYIYIQNEVLSFSLSLFFFNLPVTIHTRNYVAGFRSQLYIYTNLELLHFLNYCQFLPWVCNQPSASWQPAPVSSVSQCFQCPSFCACKWHWNPHEVLLWHLQNLWCSGDSTISSMLRFGQFQLYSSRLTSFIIILAIKNSTLFWDCFDAHLNKAVPFSSIFIFTSRFHFHYEWVVI